MGLTCSLLGHAFEGTGVERDREEQGSEVVTIVREVETCRRCGRTRTVSENKEVTAIVEPDHVGGTGDERAAFGPASETSANATTADSTTADLVGGDAEGFASGSDVEPEFEPPEDPAEEDAEILEDDRRSPREPGQWPEDERGFEPGALTGERADAADGTVDTGEDGETERRAAAVTGDVGDHDAEQSPEPTATSVPTGDYTCPECGFTTPAAGSSLREGDSCPECRRGYLAAQ